MMGTKKEELLCSVDCPHCGKSLDVIKETEVIKPPVKAEKEVTFKAAKKFVERLV